LFKKYYLARAREVRPEAIKGIEKLRIKPPKKSRGLRKSIKEFH
jgi:hypothetical protein